MKLLYGTSNPAKLQWMRGILADIDIDIVGLEDINLKVEVDESGNNPLENARIKALEYYRTVKMPVFSCDSGLFIEGVDDDKQPGVHVRRVKGKALSDEEMIQYYSGLAKSLGGEARARYINAICLILDNKNIYEYAGEDISTEEFLIIAEPHHRRNPGFPLDSISLNKKTGKYFIEMDFTENSEDENNIVKGFREFFLRISDNFES